MEQSVGYIEPKANNNTLKLVGFVVFVIVIIASSVGAWFLFKDDEEDEAVVDTTLIDETIVPSTTEIDSSQGWPVSSLPTHGTLATQIRHVKTGKYIYNSAGVVINLGTSGTTWRTSYENSELRFQLDDGELSVDGENVSLNGKDSAWSVHEMSNNQIHLENSRDGRYLAFDDNGNPSTVTEVIDDDGLFEIVLPFPNGLSVTNITETPVECKIFHPESKTFVELGKVGHPIETNSIGADFQVLKSFEKINLSIQSYNIGWSGKTLNQWVVRDDFSEYAVYSLWDGFDADNGIYLQNVAWTESGETFDNADVDTVGYLGFSGDGVPTYANYSTKGNESLLLILPIK